jgi:hypothetical protein
LSADPLGAVWGSPRPGLTLGEAVRHSVRELPWRTRQMVGVFGWVDAPATLPAWAVAWWVAVVGALAVGALWVGRWRERLAVVGSIVAVVGLTVSESLEAERIGFIWQGRYSLPLTIAIPIVSAFVVGRSGRLPALARRSLAATVFISLGLVQLLGYAVALRRYVVGGDTPLADLLDEGGWDPPVAPTALLVLAVAIIAAQIVWYLAVFRDQPAIGQPPDTSSATMISSATT